MDPHRRAGGGWHHICSPQLEIPESFDNFRDERPRRGTDGDLPGLFHRNGCHDAVCVGSDQGGPLAAAVLVQLDHSGLLALLFLCGGAGAVADHWDGRQPQRR